MAAPTFVNSYTTAYTAGTATKTTTVTTQAGDLVVVYAANENDTSGTINTPTGNGITFSLQNSVVQNNYCEAYVWSGIDSTGGTSWTLSVSRTNGNSQNWGATAIVFRNATAGTSINDPAAFPAANTADLTSITTTQANSAVVVLFADWDANADTGNNRVWQTVNGYTPSSGNGMELNYTYVNGAYTVFAAYYPDVGAIGAKSVGLGSGAPNDGINARHIAFVAMEVKGTTSSPTILNWLRF